MTGNVQCGKKKVQILLKPLKILYFNSLSYFHKTFLPLLLELFLLVSLLMKWAGLKKGDVTYFWTPIRN